MQTRNSTVGAGIKAGAATATTKRTAKRATNRATKKATTKRANEASISKWWMLWTLALALSVTPLTVLYIALQMSVATQEYGGALALAERFRSSMPAHFGYFCAAIQKLQYYQNEAQARQYFLDESDNVRRAATAFKLHPYFEGVLAFNASSEEDATKPWEAMIHKRIVHMERQMMRLGRDDFKLEKDRCVMTRFYQRHGVHTLATHGEWRSLSQLEQDLASGAAFANATEWPLFLKACHLTQGSATATRAVRKEDTSQPEALEALRGWAAQKWEQRADDADRVWAKEGNALTDSLTAGFLLQAPMYNAHSWTVEGRTAVGLPEVRVEVLWGRAYLANLDGTHIFLRNGKFQDFTNPLAMVRPLPMEDDHWVLRGGYDKCFWETAEHAARLAGVDSIRVDLFLQLGSPTGCVINENSLSSGMIYYGYEKYMAALWKEGHVRAEYELMGNGDVPVYEL